MNENGVLLRKMAELCFSLVAATLQILLRKANFNPAQPRVPAGERDGGQWTDGGGDRSGSTGRLYQVNDELGQYYVDLQKIEGYRGAHTITSHVFRSKVDLFLEMGPDASRWLPFTGSTRRQGKFGSYPDALRYANETIKANIGIVETVKAGLLGIDQGVLITKYYGHATGAEWYRDTPYSQPRWRTTYSVGVVLRHDQNCPKAFSLLQPIQETRTGGRNS